MKAVLDHIGIAVNQLPELKRLFAILGLETGHVEDVTAQGVRAHFVTLPRESAHLEFLEVLDPQGAVAKFIEKRGPGIHHLSFRVERGALDGICAQVRAAGYRLIYDAPMAGAHRMRINFIHPSSAGGMLIELMESAA
jgi:methylmalonyl-CoA/ethylmalonyl-CoA epimerase